MGRSQCRSSTTRDNKTCILCSKLWPTLTARDQLNSEGTTWSHWDPSCNSILVLAKAGRGTASLLTPVLATRLARVVKQPFSTSTQRRTSTSTTIPLSWTRIQLLTKSCHQMGLGLIQSSEHRDLQVIRMLNKRLTKWVRPGWTRIVRAVTSTWNQRHTWARDPWVRDVVRSTVSLSDSWLKVTIRKDSPI